MAILGSGDSSGKRELEHVRTERRPGVVGGVCCEPGEGPDRPENVKSLTSVNRSYEIIRFAFKKSGF